MTTESFTRQNADDRMFAGLGMPPRVVTLPWPDKVLSPNARVHWAKKAKATKLAKTDAMWACRPWAIGKIKSERLAVAYTFCPPDKRRRDLDNLVASMKAANDGIAAAVGIDDSKFECSYRMGEPVKGGSVRIEIKPI